MAHDFDPGFPRRFRTLVRNYPEGDVYPVEDFRLEWGPVFHRGRLDGTAAPARLRRSAAVRGR